MSLSCIMCFLAVSFYRVDFGSHLPYFFFPSYVGHSGRFRQDETRSAAKVIDIDPVTLDERTRQREGER